jgi:cytochrome c-type biogenesis protein CcmH/NrfF
MQEWKISFLAAALAAAGLAQTATEMEAPQVNRVAVKLMCPCGCKQNMACRMDPYPCPVCRKNKAEIIAMQAAGKSDDQIIAQFAKENGPDIVAVPPGMMGYLAPYGALAIGLGLVVLVIRLLRRPAVVPAGPPLDAATIERIEKDLAKLD